MDQLCGVVACGALGVVVVLLYFQKTLDNQKVLSLLLANYLHPFLVGSGVALLTIVSLRCLFLWSSARRRAPSHQCNHEHGVSCCHQENHEHDHRWSPVRYIVISLPIMLFCLGLPNEGFRSAKAVEVEESDLPISPKEGALIHLDFKEFYDSPYDQAKREYFQGRTGVLKGQLARGNNPTIFSLIRYVRTCCPGDAIPIYVAVVSPNGAGELKNMDWVEVTGQIQYAKRKGNNQAIPVLKVRSRQEIVPTTSEHPYYLE
jgi:hypothetical protein